MLGSCEAHTLLPSIKDSIVAMEEVEAEDPVAYVGGIHEAQLTLTSGVLNESGTGELVRDVVYLE